MNIYEPEGTDAIVDLRAAAAELKAVGSITSESARRHAVAEINTAALLDIALSLRVVAAEARAAMPSPFTETTDDAGGEPEADRDFFIEGDLVVADGMDEPGEIRGFGQSEGALYADVLFAGGAESRVWLSNLTRLVGDERDDDAMQEAAERSIEAIAAESEREVGPDGEPVGDSERGDDAPEPTDLVDDIDADFDGDHHPAAATALDVLKANEAERKAAKKAGKKGSKK
jgi:hypothetical protein